MFFNNNIMIIMIHLNVVYSYICRVAVQQRTTSSSVLLAKGRVQAYPKYCALNVLQKLRLLCLYNYNLNLSEIVQLLHIRNIGTCTGLKPYTVQYT